ncbi:CLIP domain-containing serine protease HP8-like isoform X1 [Artemia franciscana]|uniref:CLIP domain-containing serine protease HP8-like isoform X1 n=1 Tax=Artemia franciscana TaxID=6661 RepID=UPI0032DA85C3
MLFGINPLQQHNILCIHSAILKEEEERQRNRADRIGDNEVESTSGNQYDVPVDRIIEAEQRGEGREDQLVAFEADRYDVAVLTLSRPVSYQPHISPICLPDKGDDFEGDYVWAAGWGVM